MYVCTYILYFVIIDFANIPNQPIENLVALLLFKAHEVEEGEGIYVSSVLNITLCNDWCDARRQGQCKQNTL